MLISTPTTAVRLQAESAGCTPRPLIVQGHDGGSLKVHRRGEELDVLDVDDVWSDAGLNVGHHAVARGVARLFRLFEGRVGGGLPRVGHGS